MKPRYSAWLANAAIGTAIIFGTTSVFADARSQASIKSQTSEPRVSSAAANNEQAAGHAFEVGRRLAAEGKYDQACAKFEESLALHDGVGIVYNLADCEQHRGRFARAQTLFSRVAEKSRQLGQTERERAARERAMALNHEVSLLQLEFEGAPVALTLDGEPVERDATSVLAVDPGSRRLAAFAKGKLSWSKQLYVPRPGLLLVVSVPELKDATPVARKRSTYRELPSPRRRSKPAPAAKGVERGSPAAEGAALALLAVGAGGVVAGSAFGLKYLSTNSRAKETCPTSVGCKREDVAAHGDLVHDAKKARTVSYVGFAGGATALMGAALLHFTLGRDREIKASTGMHPSGAFSAALGGRF